MAKRKTSVDVTNVSNSTQGKTLANANMTNSLSEETSGFLGDQHITVVSTEDIPSEKIVGSEIDLNKLSDQFEESVYRHNQGLDLVKQAKRTRQLLGDSGSVSYDPHGSEVVRDVLGNRVNPWGDSSLSIIEFLNKMPVIGRSDQARLIQDLDMMLRGVDRLGVPRYVVSDVQFPGDVLSPRLISEYLYDLTQQTVMLPLGDLSGLSVAHQEKIRSYASLIANRVTAIADLDFLTSAQFNDFVVDNELDDNAASEALTRRNDLLHQLSSMSSAAKQKYIINNVIQPLMRSALIQRENLRPIELNSVLDAAKTYSTWLKLIKYRNLTASLGSQVLETISAADWAANLVGISQYCLTGVPHQVSFAVSTLNDALTQAGMTTSNSYSYTADDDSVEMLTPLATIRRSSEISNIHGDPLVMIDKVKFNDDSLIKLLQSRDNIIGLISIAAKLSNVEIEQKIDLSFITKRTEWAGLLSTTDTSSCMKKVEDQIAPLIEHVCLLHIMNGRFPDNPVASLFDEANRETLESAYAGVLDVFATARKAYKEVVDKLLSIAMSSLEWKNDPIWEQLISMNLITASASSPSVEWQYTRKYSKVSSLLLNSGSRLNAVDYFFDTRYPIVSSAARDLKNILSVVNAKGEMDTRITASRPFAPSYSTTVDALDLLPKMDWLTYRWLEGVAPQRLSEIPYNSPMFERKFSIKTMKASTNTGERDNDLIVLANVKPRIIVDFEDLNVLDAFPLSIEGYIMDPLDPAVSTVSRFINERDRDEILRLAIVDPRVYMEVRPFTALSVEVNPRLILPLTQQELLTSLKATSFDAKKGPEQNVVKPDVSKGLKGDGDKKPGAPEDPKA